MKLGVYSKYIFCFQPTYHQKPYSSTYPRTSDKYPSLNNNLSELDTLLQDLSSSRYNETYVNTQENGTGGYMNVRPGSGGINRPTVDALLDELDGTTNG